MPNSLQIIPTPGVDGETFDVLADGVVIGQIIKMSATAISRIPGATAGSPWLWISSFSNIADCSVTCEAAVENLIKLSPPPQQTAADETVQTVEKIIADRQRIASTASLNGSAPPVADHLVVLVHGINTRAMWMGEVKSALERAGFTVAQTSFGRFGVARFLSPLRWLRRKAINRVVSDIRTARRLFKLRAGGEPKHMSVISHSFGTQLVSKILTDYPEFQWYRIIFCGSVVRDDFPFDQVLERFSEPLLNEIGTRDYLPALAESAGWGLALSSMPAATR